jgi:hypothetical protein
VVKGILALLLPDLGIGIVGGVLDLPPDLPRLVLAVRPEHEMGVRLLGVSVRTGGPLERSPQAHLEAVGHAVHEIG